MSVISKESNFVSAVVYLPGGGDLRGLAGLVCVLDAMFAHYEVVCVHDGAACELAVEAREEFASLQCSSMTLMHMGRQQGLERAMNAGVDCAVGDFVLEVDDLSAAVEPFVGEAYSLAMRGTDIVFGALPRRSVRGTVFYPLFNRFSGSPQELTTTACSLVSRRALNRVRSMSDYMPYRKAAYASCGLEAATVVLAEGTSAKRADLGLAVDSLALYSDAFYRIAFVFSVLMSVLSLAEVVYVVAIYLAGVPIGGWTSTVLMMTLGFFGVFVILTFILKYASLLLRFQFNRKSYLVEGVERV